MTISDTSELAALMAGVGMHHWLSVSMDHGVFELMLNTILLGDVAAIEYSSNASIFTVGGSEGCESISYYWQEAIIIPANIIMYVEIRFIVCRFTIRCSADEDSDSCEVPPAG